MSGREARQRLELSRRMQATIDRNERQKRAIDRLTLMNIEAMAALLQIADADVPKLSADRAEVIKLLVDRAQDAVARIEKIRTTAVAEAGAAEESSEGKEPTSTEEERAG